MTPTPRYPRVSRTPKSERLEARVTEELKELIQRAADLTGLSLTDFVVMSAQRAAEDAIRERSVITLTARDSQLFADALLRSREPNEKLRAAFARLEKEVTSVD